MTRIVKVLSVSHVANDSSVLLLPTLFPVAISLFAMNYENLGILVALGYAANVVVQPIAGKLSDRIEAKLLIALGFTIVAFSMFVVAFSTTFLALLAGAILIRIGSSFYHPVAASAISRTRSGYSIDKYMGIQSAFGDLGSLLVFFGGALLYSSFGWKWAFAFFALIDLATAAFVFEFLDKLTSKNILAVGATSILDSYEKDQRRSGRDGSTSAVASGSATSVQVPFSFLLPAMFVSGGSYAIILNFANSLLTREYGSVLFADLLIGVCLGAFVLGDFLTGQLSRRLGRPRLLLIAYASSALFSGIFAFFPQNPVLVTLALIGVGFSLSFTFPAVYAEVGSRYNNLGGFGPERRSGIRFGIIFSIQIIGSALFAYVGGELAQLLGLVYPFAFVAAALAGTGVAGFAILLKQRS